MTGKAAGALVATWLSLSLTGKALRYATPTRDAEPRILSLVGTFLAPQGWSTRTSPARESAHFFEFRKAGCERAVVLVFLGTGAESAALLRQRLGGDLLFFQDGEPVSSPSVWRSHLRHLVDEAIAAVHGRKWERRPLFAISPAPSSKETACAPPPLTAWIELMAGGTAMERTPPAS